jgi:hypothetical protein
VGKVALGYQKPRLMFTTKDLFSKALMINLPWFIERMEFAQPLVRLVIW